MKQEPFFGHTAGLASTTRHLTQHLSRDEERSLDPAWPVESYPEPSLAGSGQLAGFLDDLGVLGNDGQQFGQIVLEVRQGHPGASFVLHRARLPHFTPERSDPVQVFAEPDGNLRVQPHTLERQILPPRVNLVGRDRHHPDRLLLASSHRALCNV